MYPNGIEGEQKFIALAVSGQVVKIICDSIVWKIATFH